MLLLLLFYMVFEVKNLFEGIDYDFYIQIFLLVDSLNLKTIFTKDTIFIGKSQFFFLISTFQRYYNISKFQNIFRIYSDIIRFLIAAQNNF